MGFVDRRAVFLNALPWRDDLLAPCFAYLNTLPYGGEDRHLLVCWGDAVLLGSQQEHTGEGSDWAKSLFALCNERGIEILACPVMARRRGFTPSHPAIAWVALPDILAHAAKCPTWHQFGPDPCVLA